jgi:SAM-dependent methyltransferase
MFLVEPMVARMVLPRLGGSPAVWSTCLVFFQAVLLLGYAYSHILTQLLSRPGQILVHAGLVLPFAALALPLDLGAGAPSPDAAPALWLLTRLALSVGPPVFVISATAPLLQRWFADTDHAAASDPYFLYAASNAGSILALLAYPLLVEPALPLERQAVLWSWGYGALALGIGVCAVAMTYRGSPVTATRQVVSRSSIGQRMVWIGLAFVPSSLLLGVTAHITADVGSAPLLWVVPLILYLLSFILVFARRPPLRHASMVRLLPLVMIPLVLTAAPGLPLVLPLEVLLALHLTNFFVVCMVCHGELARRRPPVANLTEFYLFLSIGGVLGGAFNALLAPLIFPGVWEYPLALVAACLAKPETDGDANGGGTWARARDVAAALALSGVLLLTRRFLPGAGDSGRIPILMMVAGYVMPAIILLNFSPRRWRFALGVAACLLVAAAAGSSDVIATERSFFGVYRVSVIDHGTAHQLTNGITLHGAESLLPGEADIPMSYYSREGPFGHFFAAMAQGSIRRVGVIGLGAGTLACYARPGEDWTFYEIDPLAERIARDPRFFRYLADCGNQPRVVLGDARLTIASAPDSTYDVLVVDAFSSDSIPMHLLTREAVALYLRKLAPGGSLLFHISSRTLDLRPVIGALAADAGVDARMLLYDSPPGPASWRRSSAWVVALSARGGDLNRLDAADGWVAVPSGGERSLWTDQRSDILRAIRFGF